jgi:hypothetical protein
MSSILSLHEVLLRSGFGEFAFLKGWKVPSSRPPVFFASRRDEIDAPNL